MFEKTNRSLYLTTDPAKEKTIETRFRKWFSNDLQAVSLRQTGDLKTTMSIAVKLSDIKNTDDLYFYYYNEKTNKYKRFKTNYRLDSNGFLHFFINKGGNIIISDGKLKKKI
jgi:hypothetical protein